jgi:small subunit ribosomal protein S13
MQHTPIITSLEEYKKEKIKILINLNTWRGRRYKQGYPVRGQRTRSNAKTARRLNRMKN